jgi:hypothetical protein
MCNRSRRDKGNGDTLAVYSGALPGRPLAFVREWAALHQDELRLDWELARTRQPLQHRRQQERVDQTGDATSDT